MVKILLKHGQYRILLSGILLCLTGKQNSYIVVIHNRIKKDPWPLVRKRTIPTERPPLSAK
jgi:hypothetical protein